MSESLSGNLIRQAKYEASAKLELNISSPGVSQGTKRKRSLSKGSRTARVRANSLNEKRLSDEKKSMMEEFEASGLDLPEFIKGQELERSESKKAESASKKAESASKKAERSTYSRLIGRGICQKWVDVQDRTKIVDGVITHCEQNNVDKSVLFTIRYNEVSRSLVNSLQNRCGSTVPLTRKIKSQLAFGGCILFDEDRGPKAKDSISIRKLARKKPCWKWITPDIRVEELVDSLPKLTLAVRGYKLVFTVKQSGIANAGLGVFIKATQCMDGPVAPFELEKGELVDLGIYAPFLATDRKKEAVTFVKNYIHSFKTEEWVYNTDDPSAMFDITDNHTGDIHEEAKRHIPAYVNECSSAIVPTVQAENDPEGNVHYLLGVVNGEKLSLPVNGDPMEIFVNYGLHYEKVRLRKGYSKLPPERKAAMLEQLKSEDMEYLDEISNFSKQDVGYCIDFFKELYSVGAPVVQPLVQKRSARMLQLLQKRARAIVDSDENAEELLGKYAETVSRLLSSLPEPEVLPDIAVEEKVSAVSVADKKGLATSMDDVPRRTIENGGKAKEPEGNTLPAIMVDKVDVNEFEKNDTVDKAIARNEVLQSEIPPHNKPSGSMI